jgi:hypothetical protein
MMRNRKTNNRSIVTVATGLVTVATALVISWGGVLAAQNEKQRPHEGGVMGQDVNGDGVVSLEEFDGPDEHFTQLDANGDGGIDESEAPQGPPPGGGKNFIDRLDTDGDSLVSEAEFDGPDEHFDKLDSDGDGYISADEASTGPPPRRPGGRQGGGRS